MTRLLKGGPASGKTEEVLKAAQEALKGRKRVYWVGLPHQRPYVLRRLAQRSGAALGLEYLSWQQLYYWLVAEAGRLKPLVFGLERLALVAQAMREVGLSLSPGLAALYARALAEHKRYGLTPEEEPLLSLHRAYEGLKGDRMDYDDFRLEARGIELKGPPAFFIVDGFRRHNPLDLAFALDLGKRTEVLVTGMEFPEGAGGVETLPGPRARCTVHWHANPMEELRWTLRALKQDLAKGVSPFDLLVVAPEGLIPGLLALGEEAGVPLADGRPGRLLTPLLQALLSEHPTGLDLIALTPLLPGLGDLGRKMVAWGVAGLGAMRKLDPEAVEPYLALRRALREGRVKEVLDRLPAGALPHKDRVLLAYNLAWAIDPKDPLPWWEALLREENLPPPPIQGVAVLPPSQATGVRARRAYLLRFFPEAYGALEREDPLVPEERRAPLSLSPKAPPKRLSGDGAAFLEELLYRGDEATYVSYPKADEKGPTFPPALLKRQDPKPAPPLPAASLDELQGVEAWQPRLRLGVEELRKVSLESAQDLLRCPGRFALKRLFPQKGDGPWEALLDYAQRGEKGFVLSEEALERAGREHPEWRGFLEAQRERLLATRFRVVRRVERDLPLYAVAGGVNLEAKEVYVLVQEKGEERNRFSESFFAEQGYGYRIWPFGASPISEKPRPVSKEIERAGGRLRRFLEEGFPFRVGLACSTCPVAQYCPLG